MKFISSLKAKFRLHGTAGLSKTNHISWMKKTSLVLVLTALVSTNAYAQLEEIVVTARKTEESLLETPIAVSVLSEDFFADTGINTLDDVVKFVPGFDYSPTNTTRANGTKIRGISTFSFSDGFESSVATVIDGVVMGREAQGFFDLFDVEALEVIKGPQGTLFGKNASAGVVNIRTKNPEFEFDAGGDLTLGSDNEVRIRGSVTGPLIEDKLAYRITATSHTYDGKTDNVLPGQDDINDKDTQAIRAKLLYTPSENFEALLTLDTVEEDNACCLATYRVAGEPSLALFFALNNVSGNVQQLQDSLAAAGIVPGPGNRSVAIFDDRISQVSDSSGVSLELNWSDTALGQITSITALRDWEIDEFNEADQLSLSDVNNRNGTFSSSEQFSQEIRFNGQINDSVSYVAGLFYFDQDLDADGTVFVELALPFPPFFNVATNARRSVQTESKAIFGEFTFDLSDQVSLILGGRYTDEELTADYNRTSSALIPFFPFGSFFGPDLIGTQTVNDTNFSSRAILRYTPTDNTMMYLSWSEGYKGPGIDVAESADINSLASVGGLPVLPPEIPELIELGLKTRLLDDTLAINTVIFDQSIEGVQAISTGSDGRVRNLSIDEVSSKGLELDLLYSPNERVLLSAGITYLDVEFARYDERPDLVGQAYFDVPDLAFSLTGSYDFPLGSSGYTGFVRGEYFWQDDKNTSLGGDSASDVDSYGVGNIRLGMRSPSDKYSVTLAVENVGDEDYPSFITGSSFTALDNTTTAQYLADDRTFRLTIGVDF